MVNTVEPFKEKRGAIFSEDRQYRYILWRSWGTGPMVMWLGLNPSTADERVDDPTIRRMTSFAKSWGYTGLTVCNLFGLISPHPKDLLAATDPVGNNDRHLLMAADKAASIVCCWGAFNVGSRAQEVGQLLVLAGHNLQCLGRNRGGSPKHPLYLSTGTALEPFNIY